MLYLASASPRRQELLLQAGLIHEALPPSITEERLPGERPAAYVHRVAADKARQVARWVVERGLPVHPVLGADTEVVVGDEIFGKPLDRTQAAGMLRRLSGRTHTVLTAISLISAQVEYSALCQSQVTFAELTDTTIERYLATGEADDKAGAYAIQGQAAVFIARLEGSYSGVMGLPLYELHETLKRAGLEAL